MWSANIFLHPTNLASVFKGPVLTGPSCPVSRFSSIHIFGVQIQDAGPGVRSSSNSVKQFFEILNLIKLSGQ